LVLDHKGNPVCSELWPGNTADVTSLAPLVERLRTRFSIGSVCIVADRGMISTSTLAEVEKRNRKCILGVRMRSSNEAKAVVTRAGHYAQVHAKSDDPKAPSPLK
jgi:transposase